MSEVWKVIEDNNQYSVSNQGRVMNNKTKRILKVQIKRIKKTGYEYYRYILRKNKKATEYRVSVLLGKHFIPNPDNLPEIDHINRNSLDNRLENLRWCDRSTNRLNRRKPKHNTSGFKNICIQDNMFRYRKDINKEIFVVFFKTKQEAIDFKNYYEIFKN